MLISHLTGESKSLDDFLKSKNIPGISGIDTRKLTRIIRQYGTLKGAICNIEKDANEIIAQLKAVVLPTDQVKRVSTKVCLFQPWSWTTCRS